jgi:hypothetical protein
MRRSRVRAPFGPPIFKAQPLSVGRFHFCLPHVTLGFGPFCVCRRSADKGLRRARFASLPPYLLSKPAPTSSPWHTHMSWRDRDLRVCRRYRLPGELGAAVHHANTLAAHGIEYSPARRCVTTRATPVTLAYSSTMWILGLPTRRFRVEPSNSNRSRRHHQLAGTTYRHSRMPWLRHVLRGHLRRMR